MTKPQILKEITNLVKAHETICQLEEVVGEGVFSSPIGQNCYENYENAIFNILLDHTKVYIVNKIFAKEIFCDTIYSLSTLNFDYMTVPLYSVEQLYDYFSDESNFNVCYNETEEK